MFEELQKKTFKNCLVLAVIFLIIGVGLIAFSAQNLFYSLFGFADFTQLPPNKIRSQLVELNLTTNFGCYLEEYEYNKDTHYRRTTDLYYIIWTGDDYATDFRYMTVKVPASFEKQMEAMADNTAREVLSEPINIFGKIKKLGSEEYSYFTDSLKEAGWSDEEIKEYTLPYYIDYYESKGGTRAGAILLFGGGVAMLAAGIYRIVKGKKGGFLKDFRNDIAISGYPESYIESDYRAAQPITKSGDIKMGRLMTYYIIGSTYRAIPHNKITWAYQSTTTHRTNGIKTGTTYSVMYYAENYKSAFNLGVPNETTAQEILQKLLVLCPWVIVGYSDDLRQLFNKDHTQFLQMRYNTMEHNPAEPGFNPADSSADNSADNGTDKGADNSADNGTDNSADNSADNGTDNSTQS